MIDTEFTVENCDGLIAAIRAMAQPTALAASENAFTVALAGTRCRWTFKQGVTKSRAEHLAQYLPSAPSAAFQP